MNLVTSYPKLSANVISFNPCVYKSVLGPGLWVCDRRHNKRIIACLLIAFLLQECGCKHNLLFLMWIYALLVTGFHHRLETGNQLIKTNGTMAMYDARK